LSTDAWDALLGDLYLNDGRGGRDLVVDDRLSIMLRGLRQVVVGGFVVVLGSEEVVEDESECEYDGGVESGDGVG